MTSPTHRAPVDDHRGGGWASVLRWVALTGTLSGIATLEYLAGQAAGWGTVRSIAVPATLDAFVMSVLLADRARWYDRAAALGLMESTVVISAIAGHHGQGDDTRLGAILATALVFVLWRVDETFRTDRQHGDALAAAEGIAHGLRIEVARLSRQLEERAVMASPVGTIAAESKPEPRDLGYPPVPRKVAPKVDAKRPAPSREQASAILGALDSLDDKSNAELSREHGGTPEYWGQRKKDYRAGLAKLGAEAGNL